MSKICSVNWALLSLAFSQVKIIWMDINYE